MALYADDLYSYLRHRLIPRVDLAEDLLQEVFLAAWKNLARFEGMASLKTWLLAIARHKIQDHYRRRMREIDTIEDEVEQPTSPPDLDAGLDRVHLQGRVQRILADLPEAYSMVLLWRYWEQRSTREIAADTGKTEKAVERLLARARALFKQRWNDE